MHKIIISYGIVRIFYGLSVIWFEHDSCGLWHKIFK